MSSSSEKLLSLVIPVFNEERNINAIHTAIEGIMTGSPYAFEMIFVDDGSSDRSAEYLQALAARDSRVKVLEFSRNFGKEAATSAGIAAARGDAIILIDADLQHPPEYIPEFVRAWEAGAEVVIGVRAPRKKEGLFRRLGSRTFSALMNAIGDTKSPPRATDFRLIDRTVADAFLQLSEHRRITRSLIDWLGFRRAYVPFVAAEREGENRYNYPKLISLAASGIVGHSRLPLLLAGYIGIPITLFAGVFGLFIIVEQFLLGDPLQIAASGASMLAILTLFLTGIMLSCIGLVAVYIGAIQEEVVRRPLYVLRSSPRMHARHE